MSVKKIPTENQVSAGGVVCRILNGRIETVLISVGEDSRWQLPKGLIDPNESPEMAALREVREETGIESQILEFIAKAEYWYSTKRFGQQVRFHKVVHFYLMRYQSGSTENHDREVNEARWIDLDAAHAMLAFQGEKEILAKAKNMIESFESSRWKELPQENPLHQ